MYCIPEKYNEIFIDYFPSSKNGMAVSVKTQKVFHTIEERCKPPVEKIGIWVLGWSLGFEK